MNNPTEIEAELRQLMFETPSWAYANSGTRFKVFAQKGVAHTPFEKIEDAAQVHLSTGAAPSVAMHIPWDQVDHDPALQEHALRHGISIVAINPNVFQEDDDCLGSVCNPDAAIRHKAINHMLDFVEIAVKIGSTILSLWFADGTNYPGQEDIQARQERLAGALRETYDAMPSEMRMLLEYKFFELSFGTMDVPDWGTFLVHCLALGERAQVLVDSAHHAPGTNIEFIVANLVRTGRLGGFHCNSRFYADDDLMVGSADPYQLFRIMNEIVTAGAHRSDSNVAFMLDQCHKPEPRIPAEIRSVMNVQEATAKALFADRSALAKAQADGDVLEANGILVDAFNTDVRPLLGELREDMGLDADPRGAYRRSGYAEQIVAERATGSAAGWGA